MGAPVAPVLRHWTLSREDLAPGTEVVSGLTYGKIHAAGDYNEGRERQHYVTRCGQLISPTWMRPNLDPMEALRPCGKCYSSSRYENKYGKRRQNESLKRALLHASEALRAVADELEMR